jgi:hypothetical protein
MIRGTALVAIVFLLGPGLRAETPLGTAFTYQGRLTDGGGAANGLYDLQFTLFSAETEGTQVGPIVTAEDVAVTDGLFTVPLDFGAAAFAGDARWLELAVRPGAGGPFTVLGPRQALTATPNALYSRTAGAAATVSGLVAVANGGTGASLAATGGPGQYVKQANPGAALIVGPIPASDLTGVLGVAGGGTGSSLAGTGGPGQLVRQSTPGGPLSVAALAASDIPAHTHSAADVTSGTLPVSRGGTGQAAATSAKLNPTVLASEGNTRSYSVDTTPAGNVRVCPVGPYAAATDQRALVDAGIAWSALSSASVSVAVLVSTNGGASWSAAFAVPFYDTNAPVGWGSSARSAVVDLDAGSSYLFAVAGWGASATTVNETRCHLRVVVVGR